VRSANTKFYVPFISRLTTWSANVGLFYDAVSTGEVLYRLIKHPRMIVEDKTAGMRNKTAVVFIGIFNCAYPPSIIRTAG
jgi:hypothetical protein